MSRASARRFASSIALLGVTAGLAGCGFGPGDQIGSSRVIVTRDYGMVSMYDEVLPVRESDDAMRLLTDLSAEVGTSYGGGFVDSIDGYGSGSKQGVETDWFFFVDGTESPVGALEARVAPGETVWWDRRDWSQTMHVPAVVGSWPRPFGQDSPTVSVACLMSVRRACQGVVEDLRGTGSRVVVGRRSEGPLRVLIGPWREVRRDRLASSLERGPSASGVYATFAESGGEWLVSALDSSGRSVGGPWKSGIVAALSGNAQSVTWVVSGSDEASVPTGLLSADLEQRYAVLYRGGTDSGAVGVPVR